MRLLAAFLVFGQSEFPVKIDRSLQPRHPQNRNARLHKFAQQWLETNIQNEKFRERIWQRWQKWGESMQKAYDRDQCGYFNPENPNDGDPAPHHNHKLDKPRRARTRRDTIFDITNDHNDKNNDNEIYADMSRQEWEEKAREGTWEMLFDGEDSVKGLRGRKDLITQNPERAIKNILSGFKRFAKRYIAGCHAERVKQSHSGRAKKLTEKLLNHYEKQLTTD